MNILIIGASGFVSGAMGRHGVNRGDKVWGISRGTKPVPQGVIGITADRKDRAAFAAAIDKIKDSWDLVIDCIGFSADDARQDLDCFEGRAKHLVYVSSDFACSPVGRPWKIDETFGRFDTSGYGAGKRQAEEVLLEADGGEMRVTILRPCHIYGPGSLLGCLPEHGRDAKLIARMRAGETLKLVGGGYFLQQPVFVGDLAAMAYSCVGKESAASEVYFAAGPEVIQSRDYYQIVADELGVKLNLVETSIEEYLKKHPGNGAYCCHRVYAMDKARQHGLAVPATLVREGLKEHVAWAVEHQ